MSTTIPLFPLRAPLLPGMVLPLQVLEGPQRLLVRDLLAAAENGMPAVFGAVSIVAGHGFGDPAALAEIGCLADVRAIGSMPDGQYELVTLGMHRFHIDRVIAGDRPYLQADVSLIAEPSGVDTQELAESVRLGFRSYGLALQRATGRPTRRSELPTDPTLLSYTVGAAMVLPSADQQRVLAAPDTGARLSLLLDLLTRERTILTELRAVPALGLAGAVPSLN